MAPSALEGGSISELNTVTELREWLLGRVGDDNDIVIDDLQEEFAEQFELEDEKRGIRVRRPIRCIFDIMIFFAGK